MLILGNPLHVFYPVLLFYLADGGQDVRFTPVQKNGGKLRDEDDGHQRREINGESKTSKGKLAIFLKPARKFLIIPTRRPVTSTEPLTDTHSET